MRKVKEYLDEYFYPDGEISTEERKNGHLGVFGCWVYPKGWKPEDWNAGKKEIDHIAVSINNETILVDRICINGKYCSKYGYLQTYEHLPRGLPDNNGYYQRSTEEEVVRYIDSYFQILANQIIRKRKLKILNEI
jgi:hypothetical protein